MKKISIFAACAFAALGAAPAAAQQAVVTLPANDTIKSLGVSHALLSNMLTARSQADLGVVEENVAVENGKAVITLDKAGAARYSIAISPETAIDFYAAPDETLSVDVTSVNPLDYSVSGTALMEGMSRMERQLAPVTARQNEIMASGVEPDAETIGKIREDMTKVFNDYVKANPDDPAAVYALLNLSGEDFLDAFGLLGENARKSILFPFAEAQRPMVEQNVAKERMQRELASGKHEAPAFTLPDLEGKEVSLSQFKGKWVILDFWGSWCIWCIKGFPKLKATYEQYKDRLEVIGIDCRDSKDAWKAAVAKYELPWVNVYKEDSNTALLESYGVQGFPTKAIVNPEGKIVDITTGEDPSFYDRLASFISRQ